MRRPRKLRLAAAIVASDTPIANWAATMRMMFGQTWRRMIQADVPPAPGLAGQSLVCPAA
jgi:hypothetical protein